MARSIYLPLGRLAEHRPAHPERTGYRAGPGLFSDYEIREWPSVGALETTIRMEGRRTPKQTDWRKWKIRALSAQDGGQ